MKTKAIKHLKKELAKQQIEVEKEILKRYVKVLAKYHFADSSIGAIYFDELFHNLLKSGFEFIDSLGLSEKEKNNLRYPFSGLFNDSDGLTIEEHNLKYYKQLVSWAKNDLESLPMELKEKIIQDSIAKKELWNQQFNRNLELYDKYKKK